MLFLQLSFYSNGLSVILEKPLLSVQSRPAQVKFYQILPKQAQIGKTKSVFLKLRINRWSKSLAIKTTFFTLYLSNLNPEEEVSSLKIDGFTADYISKLKWARQAQFLSHILVILRNSVFFEDKQMILLSLFDISTGFRFPKNLKSCSIQAKP